MLTMKMGDYTIELRQDEDYGSVDVLVIDDQLSSIVDPRDYDVKALDDLGCYTTADTPKELSRILKGIHDLVIVDELLGL